MTAKLVPDSVEADVEVEDSVAVEMEDSVAEVEVEVALEVEGAAPGVALVEVEEGGEVAVAVAVALSRQRNRVGSQALRARRLHLTSYCSCSHGHVVNHSVTTNSASYHLLPKDTEGTILCAPLISRALFIGRDQRHEWILAPF